MGNVEGRLLLCSSRIGICHVGLLISCPYFAAEKNLLLKSETICSLNTYGFYMTIYAKDFF